MTKTRSFLLFLQLVFCIPIGQAQDIVVADSTKSFVRNDTTFLDWRYLLMENEAGCYDTCIQGHFVIPKGTPGLMDKILRNMSVNYLTDGKNPDTLLKTPRQTIPNTGNIVENFGRITDYSVSITPAFAKIIRQSENVLPLYQGKASVKVNGLWGVVDVSGNWILPCIYATPPHYEWTGTRHKEGEPLSIVTGDVPLIEGPYSDVRFLVDKHIALYNDSLWTIFDMHDLQAEDKPLFEDVYRANLHHFSYKENGKWGVKDYHYNTVIPAIYDTPPIAPLGNDSLFLVKQNDKKGVVDKENKTIIPIIYQDLWPWSDRYFAAKQEHWGLINAHGETVIPLIFESIEHLGDTLMLVENANGFGVLSLTGKYILPCQYSAIEPLGNRLYAVSDSRMKDAVVDSENHIVIPYQYDHIESFTNNRFLIRSNGKYGYLNPQGQEVIPLKYSWAKPFYNGYAWVRKNVVSWSIIDTNGRKLIPFSNHHHYIPTDEPFSGEGGTVCVERKGMYGIMDSTGKMLVPFISHAPTYFSNGIALIFDKDDHITACADKESTYAFSEPYSYYARQEEFVLVERNNQYGILDLKKHQLVIPIIYDEIGEISPEGIAIALRNGRWGFVDIHGNTTFQ